MKKEAGRGPSMAVRKRDWDALVRFFRDEEKVLRDSYNSPGRNDWEVFYKKNSPEGWAVHDAARRAASRRPRVLKGG